MLSVFLSLTQTLPGSFFHGKVFYFFHFGKVHLQRVGCICLHMCCTSAVSLFYVCWMCSAHRQRDGCTCAGLLLHLPRILCIPAAYLLCVCFVFAACFLHTSYLCFAFAACLLRISCASTAIMLKMEDLYAWVTDSGCSGIYYSLPATKGSSALKALHVLAKIQTGIW